VTAPRARARRYDPVDCAQETGEPEVDQIDAGEAENKIRIEDDALVEELVQHVEQRRFIARIQDEISG
jgi:hypothetical protein